jgi:DNA-binding CsgD family transcriptional regulator
MTTRHPDRGAGKGGAVWVRQREAKALQLRAAGATYALIANRLGIGETMARRVVQRALARVVREPAHQLITLELERLDLLWRSMFARALGGSARHAEVCLRVLERRARLLGLDAPTRSEVHVMSAEEMDALDREIEGLLRIYRDGGGDL